MEMKKIIKKLIGKFLIVIGIPFLLSSYWMVGIFMWFIGFYLIFTTEETSEFSTRRQRRRPVRKRRRNKK